MKSRITAGQGIVFAGLALMIGCSQASAASPVPVAPAHKPSKPASPAAKTYSGPFGLAKGISQAELVESHGLVWEVEANRFGYSGKPPKPVDGIDEYFYVASPKAGLCQISVHQNVKQLSGSGDQLKAAVDRYAALLELKYGKQFDKSDLVRGDVYRRNPQFWMVGLQEKSVTYSYTWLNATSPLPNQLKRVQVMAVARPGSGGYVAIRYAFDNASDCVAEIQAAKAADL